MAGNKSLHLSAAGCAGVAALVTAITLVAAGPDIHGWLLAARYTARFSFATFLVAFLGPRCVPGRLGGKESALIIGFAAAHGIHFLVLVTYRLVEGSVPPASSLAVGGIGYVSLGLLAFLTLRGSVSGWIGSAVLNYLLAVFVLTYVLKIPLPDQYVVGVAGTVVGVAAYVARLVAGRFGPAQVSAVD